MKEELKVIMDLMQDLQNKMEYGEDDLSERLGRKKPGLEVVKIEGKLPMGEEEGMEEESEMPFGMGSSKSMEEDCEMEDGPESQLKKRLLKLRA